MRATQATFKLGIFFDNWGAPGESYIHTFGVAGQSTWMAGFHQYWMEARANGFGGSLEDYCLELKAANAGKFAVKAGETLLAYAFHLDATAYAGFLRQKSESLGVRRVEGKIGEITVDPVTGNIRSLELEQDRQVAGEFWNYYRTMDIPDSLAHRMELFRENGHVWPDSVNLFRTNSWVQVMIGQGLFPKHRHGAGRILSPEALKRELEKLSSFVNHNLAKLPDHDDFIKQYCPARN